jgi:hypothetical protein
MSFDKVVGGCVILSIVLMLAFISGMKHYLTKKEKILSSNRAKKLFEMKQRLKKKFKGK